MSLRPALSPARHPRCQPAEGALVRLPHPPRARGQDSWTSHGQVMDKSWIRVMDKCHGQVSRRFHPSGRGLQAQHAPHRSCSSWPVPQPPRFPGPGPGPAAAPTLASVHDTRPVGQADWLCTHLVLLPIISARVCPPVIRQGARTWRARICLVSFASSVRFGRLLMPRTYFVHDC